MISRDEMELRRLQAATLLAHGFHQGEVSRKIKVSRASVSRWARKLNDQGMESLRRHRATGRPARISRQQIRDLFLQHPDNWTCFRLVAAIEDQYGIRYNRDHIGKILHQLRVEFGFGKPRKVSRRTQEAVCGAA